MRAYVLILTFSVATAAVAAQTAPPAGQGREGGEPAPLRAGGPGELQRHGRMDPDVRRPLADRLGRPEPLEG